MSDSEPALNSTAQRKAGKMRELPGKLARFNEDASTQTFRICGEACASSSGSHESSIHPVSGG
jgi:hypothetical protein